MSDFAVGEEARDEVTQGFFSASEVLRTVLGQLLFLCLFRGVCVGVGKWKMLRRLSHGRLNHEAWRTKHGRQSCGQDGGRKTERPRGNREQGSFLACRWGK